MLRRQCPWRDPPQQIVPISMVSRIYLRKPFGSFWRSSTKRIRIHKISETYQNCDRTYLEAIPHKTMVLLPFSKMHLGSREGYQCYTSKTGALMLGLCSNSKRVVTPRSNLWAACLMRTLSFSSQSVGGLCRSRRKYLLA